MAVGGKHINLAENTSLSLFGVVFFFLVCNNSEGKFVPSYKHVENNCITSHAQNINALQSNAF